MTIEKKESHVSNFMLQSLADTKKSLLKNFKKSSETSDAKLLLDDPSQLNPSLVNSSLVHTAVAQAGKDTLDVKKNIGRAATTTLNVSESIWKLANAKDDSLSQSKATAEVQTQVIDFALSLGQTKVTNVTVRKRDASNIIVLTSQDSSRSLEPGSFAADIEYNSELLGQKIRSKWTVWMTPGFFWRVGLPYNHVKNKDESGVRARSSVQNTLRGGLGETGIQGFLGLRRLPFISQNRFFKNKDTSEYGNVGFSSVLRLGLKQVNDYNRHKSTDKYVETPSMAISLDFSTYVSAGPLRLGPYIEGGFKFGRRSRENGPPDSSVKNSKLGLFFIDPCNVGLNPAFIRYAVAHGASKEMTYVGGKVLQGKARQAAISSGVRFLGYGVEKLLPSAVRTTVFLAEAAEPVGWALALGVAIWDIAQDYDEQKKKEYSVKVLAAVGNKLYDPQIGIPVALKAIADGKQANVGNAVRFISDVIDEACVRNLANASELREKWQNSLNFKGNNLIQTQYGRLIAAGVLGRKDVISDVIRQLIPRDKSGNTIHTGSNALQDKLDNSILVTSLDDPEKLKSRILVDGSNIKPVTYKRVGAAYNVNTKYSQFKARFMGGTVEAIAGKPDDRGTALWSITLITRDGLRAKHDVVLTGAFSLKQFLKGEWVKKSLEDEIAAQRLKLKIPPKYLTTYRGNLFGGAVTAKPVFVQPDGQIMWKVNARSSSGVSAEIYESLDHQFGINDLQPGHYFRLKLEDIMKSIS